MPLLSKNVVSQERIMRLRGSVREREGVTGGWYAERRREGNGENRLNITQMECQSVVETATFANQQKTFLSTAVERTTPLAPSSCRCVRHPRRPLHPSCPLVIFFSSATTSNFAKYLRFLTHVAILVI